LTLLKRSTRSGHGHMVTWSTWSHDGLLYKLKCLNTPTVIFNIIKSFLHSRSFTVQIDGTKSDVKQINAGVPQGSKISPILFNLYISDFPTSTNTEIALYADDSVIYSSSDKIENVTANIQTHLDKILKWAQKWKIILNPTKSTAVIFTLRRPTNYNIYF
jgi:retron-type reverse transcriptase